MIHLSYENSECITIQYALTGSNQIQRRIKLFFTVIFSFLFQTSFKVKMSEMEPKHVTSTDKILM